MKKYILLFFTLYSLSVLALTGCNSNEEVDTTQTSSEATTEATTAPINVDLIMVGDILAHEGVYNSGKQADGSYNFDHLFTHIKNDASSADIALVNQEVILGGTQMGLSAYPMFNSPTEIGDALVNAGFNVILHASNHALDKGAKGIENTLDFWKTKHPDTAVLGINSSQEDYNNIYIFEKDGFKIAILNYTYGTNGMPIPSSKPYIINVLDENKVASDISRAEGLADFTIVCPHWGTEYTLKPTTYQINWAKLMIENGADLIIGTHPHVVEPMEFVTSDNGNSALVYYSLGNFVSNQDTAETMLGAMARVRLTKEGDKAFISSYTAEPLVTHQLYGRGLITTYKLKDYTQELASQNKVSIFGVRLTMEKLDSIWREVFPNLYFE